MDLRAALFSSQSSARSRPSQSSSLAHVRRVALSKNIYTRSNAGIAERNAKDLAMEQAQVVDQKAAMIRKTQMYEKLGRGHIIWRWMG